MTEVALLNQFGYSVNPNSIEQVKRIVHNTKGFEHIEKHLLTLNDKLKSHLSFVSLSSSKDYFKIKNTAPDEEVRKFVKDIIYEWAQKYKVELEKVPNKDTYYVVGYTG